MTTIPLTSIDDSNRARKDYGDLEGLKNSLKNLGSIHPIVLSRNAEGTYNLIAGGRRFRATKDLGVTELTHGSILEPGRVGFLYQDEVPPDVLREAELDENLFRLKPRWQEDVQLIADVHELKRSREGRKWGIVQTSELLGKGYGNSNVSYALRIAKCLAVGDEEIEKCDNMSDAIAVLVKRKEDEFLTEMHKRLGDSAPKIVDTSSFLDKLNINLGGKKMALLKGNQILSTLDPSHGAKEEREITANASSVEGSSPSDGTRVVIPLSRMFFNGDCLAFLPHFPDATFDHVVTDIPYGIDMKNLDTRDMSSVEAEHEVQQNVDMMEPFLKESFRLTKSGGFCVFFYDLDWHEYLQTTAELIGWKVQRWPLIALKTSPCQNNAAQYNFTKNYECAMVLRRDEKTVLRNQQPTSVWMGDFSAERRLYNNPFAKPFELWKWIYSAISFPGQSTLDPFCGEMSASRAAANCGLVPYGIELKSDHYLRGLEHMKGIFGVIHKGNVDFQ